MCSQEGLSKEDLDALAFLSQIHRGLHESRIGRELKVVVASITLFVVAAGVSCTGTVRLTLPMKGIVWLGFACVVALVCRYMRGSAKANQRNQGLAEAAEDAVLRALMHKEVTEIELYERRFPLKGLKAKDEQATDIERHPNWYRWLWQVVIVAVGAVLSAVLIALT